MPEPVEAPLRRPLHPRALASERAATVALTTLSRPTQKSKQKFQPRYEREDNHKAYNGSQECFWKKMDTAPELGQESHASQED